MMIPSVRKPRWSGTSLHLMWPFLLLAAVLLAPGLPAAGADKQAKPGGGLDASGQRAEMIRLLRSIDSRLEKLVEVRR